MRALTLTQPFATLIALRKKCIETRSWPAPRSVIGQRLAIHAAKGWPNEDRLYQFSDSDWVALLMRLGLTDVTKFPRGAIVATATLAEVVRMTRSVYDDPPMLLVRGKSMPITEQEDMLGGYAPGRYAWLLEDVEPLPAPIPARGSLGLWEWDEGVLLDSPSGVRVEVAS